MKKKVLRIAAVPGSLAVLLTGQLKFLNQYYDVIGVASGGTRLDDVADQEEIRVIPVNISRQINLFGDVVSLFKLYKVFKKEKPYIVHSITPKAGLLSMLAAFLAGVPYRLHTFTGLVFPTSKGFKKKMLIFFDKVICSCATNIYPEGQGVKNDLIAYKITKKPLKIIGNGNVNGIDLSHFDPALYGRGEINTIKDKYGIKASDFVFLFVGRMGFDKGITELITSFTEIQKTNPDIKLLLVGPYEKHLDPLPESVEHELENNIGIISVGYQRDVRPYFASGDVFVFPSYREGFPNVPLQAGAMGKFCIVTDINGSNEIIEHGVNGVIIPPRDSQALSRAMMKCLKNKEEYKNPNSKYREIIGKKYERHTLWNALLKEYQTLR